MQRQAIFITGGTGSVGRGVVRRLCGQGRYVKVVGRRPSAELPADYAQCDVTDLDGLMHHMAGCDAVVHLAAVPRPGLSTPQDLFHVNACGTFRVYEAATRCGIDRVVTASTINALGCSFGPRQAPLHYFPVDEEHPTFTSDPYSFSKNVLESIGAYYHRREGLSSISLRLPWVRQLSEEEARALQAEQEGAHALVEELLGRPDHPWLENWRQMHARLHDLRVRETLVGDGWDKPEPTPEPWGAMPDPLTWNCLFGRDNFWAAIDTRDCARSVELAMDADTEGSHALFVSDSRNWLGVASEKLLQVFFPEVTGRKKHLKGAESLVSTAKAQRLIGFTPQHHLSHTAGGRDDRGKDDAAEGAGAARR